MVGANTPRDINTTVSSHQGVCFVLVVQQRLLQPLCGVLVVLVLLEVPFAEVVKGEYVALVVKAVINLFLLLLVQRRRGARRVRGLRDDDRHLVRTARAFLVCLPNALLRKNKRSNEM